jgi:hypothetical protein
MNIQRKRVVVAVTVLAAFAMAAVPASAGEEAAVKGTAPACRVDLQDRSAEGPALAEYHLSALAASSRRSRHLAGGFALAVGAAGLWGGLAILHEVGEEEPVWNYFFGLGTLGGIMMITAGGATLAGGILSLAVVSPAESRYAGILGIADSELREAACAEALMGLARRGKRSRTARAVLYGALGLVAAASSGSDGMVTAGCGGGLALLSALVKSRAERAYQSYLEGKGGGLGPELILGMGPRGGFRAGLSLDF